MTDCCVRSFVLKGIDENFKTGKLCDEHQCPACGQRYVLLEHRDNNGNPAWMPVNPSAPASKLIH